MGNTFEVKISTIDYNHKEGECIVWSHCASKYIAQDQIKHISRYDCAKSFKDYDLSDVLGFYVYCTHSKHPNIKLHGDTLPLEYIGA